MGTHSIGPKLTKAQMKRYDARMDQECVPICDALNALPGIETFESCCGHGAHHFMIFFTADAVEHIRPLLCEIHDRVGWVVEVQWANGGDRIYYGLFSRNVDMSNFGQICKEADEIAQALG